MELKSKYAKEVGGYKDRFWYPRIWNGMTLYPFTKLLIRNKFWILFHYCYQTWNIYGKISYHHFDLKPYVE